MNCSPQRGHISIRLRFRLAALIGFLPAIVALNELAPTETKPQRIALTLGSLRKRWAHLTPSSSEFLMKHFESWSGWPPMPPSFSFTYLTANSARFVAVGPIGGIVPPSLFTQPILTGESFGSAAPAFPHVYATYPGGALDVALVGRGAPLVGNGAQPSLLRHRFACRPQDPRGPARPSVPPARRAATSR